MEQLRGTPLKRFLRDWRRTHAPQRDLALVLQSVSYPANVGSLFRIADAAGVSKMFLCGATALPPSQTISKVGRDKDKDVPWFFEKRAEDAIQALRSEGYTIYAVEITDFAKPYYDIAYPNQVCLVVGNEDHGVTRSALAQCDSAVFVPMYGKGHSLNVHVCAAIIIYHIHLQKP